MAWDIAHQEATECLRARQMCEASGSTDPTDPAPFGKENGDESARLKEYFSWWESGHSKSVHVVMMPRNVAQLFARTGFVGFPRRPDVLCRRCNLPRLVLARFGRSSQLVDCETVDSASNGRLMVTGFALADKSATRTEASYSYTGNEGTRLSSSCTVELGKEVLLVSKR